MAWPAGAYPVRRRCRWAHAAVPYKYFKVSIVRNSKPDVVRYKPTKLFTHAASDSESGAPAALSTPNAAVVAFRTLV